MKRLLIMRHAEAAAGDVDHDRPLTDGGRAAADALAGRLADAGVGVDAVVSSTAVRAMQTAVIVRDRLVPGNAAPAEFHTDAGLYDAPAEAWAAAAARLAEGWDDVLMVGHNPAVAAIAWQLTGEALAVPPGTILDVRLPAWADLGGGRLAAVWTPAR